jgi:pimeloyl-ACP methyl ester carboxylesterase
MSNKIISIFERFVLAATFVTFAGLTAISGQAVAQSATTVVSWHQILGDQKDLASTGFLTVDHTKKAEVVAVFLHGLYGSKEQFRLYSLRLLDFGIPSVRISLPGHDDDSDRSEIVTAIDWQNRVREVIDLVRPHAKHIILVGQSTGGALALVEASERKSVDALWLIEPALRVRPLAGVGACVMSAITSDMRNFTLIGSLVGQTYNEHTPKISPKMGCLVDPIWRTHIGLGIGHGDLNSGYSMREFIQRSRSVIGQLPLKVFIQNTPGDRLVDSAVISALRDLPNVAYKETGKEVHGDIVISNLDLNDDIDSMLYATSTNSDLIRRVLAGRLISRIQAYGGGKGREADLSYNIARWDQDSVVEKSDLCRHYVEEARRLNATRDLFHQFKACMVSIGRDW